MRVEELDTLAGMLTGRGDNVCVQYNTDGKASAGYDDVHNRYTINIPLLPGNNSQADAMTRGYLDHEAGHVLFSDYYDLKNACSGSDEIKKYANIYEDVYVETEMGMKYPGSRTNLARLAERLFTLEKLESDLKAVNLHYKASHDNAFYFDALVTAALLHTRRASLVPGIEPAAQMACGALKAALEAALGRVGGDKYKEFKRLFDKNAESTSESISLAINLNALVSEVVKMANEQRVPDSGNSSQRGNDSDVGNSGQDSQSDNDGEDDDDSGQDNGDCEDAAGTGGNAKSARRDISKKALKSLENMADMGDRVKNEFDKYKDIMASKDARKMDRPLSVINMINRAAADGCFFSLAYDAFKADETEIARHASQISRSMLSILQSENFVPGRIDWSGRHISTRSLYKVALGSGRIFRERSVQISMNCEIQILCDCSQSMCRTMPILLNGVYGMWRALHGERGVSVKVKAFMDDKVGDITPKAIGQYKIVPPVGGTLMGNAMLKVLRTFTGCDTRKILFMFTDGDTEDEPLVRRAVEIAAASGIELYAIALCTRYLEYRFPEIHNAVIDDMKDFAKTLRELMLAALRKRV